VKNIYFFVMAGGNEAQRSDRMELPKDSNEEGECGWSKRSLRCVSFPPAMLLRKL
jgi:hypothetical protein